ncbi:MAG: type I DNA topoisomerase [Thiobacillus sp.]|uniref:type I DNA topoisomerase n=1 Tax=Thiobacillus sp. TaxID=924 RepID=UPI002893FA14|nr:type I DNA topoisomerase [Thiobacillus sp.]MDT3707181.1 type I DNA topoisomerase [Thiobacillus sp.]
MSKLVIVESPSKSKSLKKYLGADYDILASYGHVRDLEPKTGAVDTENFSMKYQIIERNAKHVDAIVKAAKKADEVLLATDPDREGEAISWHISEILKEKKVKTPMKRVAFYEITESAIQDAVRHPREIASDLVDAQQARRALDYLVGFNLSPLLWKKISPGLSAGRVQSPALRMIVEREEEIEAFVPREYWTLHLDTHKGAQPFTAKLTHFRGEKLEQFSVEHEARSTEWLATLAGRDATVMRIDKKRRARNPAAPFTTSTLQQAGVRQLGMTTDRVMRTAQQLYEGIDLGEGPVGLITYMRTDSVNLAQEAITDIRKYVGAHFDKDYLPPSAIAYKAKTKNAQEAHEAVRPTAVARTPEAVKAFLTHDQARLYELIWKRTVACQMTAAQFDTVAADITVGEGTFRATGQTLAFPGFLAVYQDDEEEEESKLPALAEGETLPVDRLYGEQHFTQPPPRYTEASLVKALEEYGIGRPSTYASIISTLQDREYVVLEKKRFQPTDVGRLVNCFLTRHFTHYVDYDFTAKLEDKLDDVSNGKREWTRLLGEFWDAFDSDLKAKQDVERGCPIPEACPKCGKPLFMQASKRGLFIGCSGYPECDYTRPLHPATAEGDNILGKDPATSLDVKLLSGRFGPYVQIGDMPADKKAPKPRRASWPKDIPLENATLELALKFLSLPREVGHHPVTGLPIVANNGRFGPYLLHDGKFKSIPKTDSVYEIELPRALEVLAMERAPRGESAAAVLKDLGPHPDDGKDITVRSGRYGPYVKHGSTNATLPKDIAPEEITLGEALALIAARAAKGPARKPARKAATKPAAAKKSATADTGETKQPATRKTATKKATAKKATTAKKPARKKADA